MMGERPAHDESEDQRDGDNQCREDHKRGSPFGQLSEAVRRSTHRHTPTSLLPPTAVVTAAELTLNKWNLARALVGSITAVDQVGMDCDLRMATRRARKSTARTLPERPSA